MRKVESLFALSGRDSQKYFCYEGIVLAVCDVDTRNPMESVLADWPRVALELFFAIILEFIFENILFLFELIEIQILNILEE